MLCIDAMERGGLNIPIDKICQWSIFCFILFNAIKEKVRRKSFYNLFMVISEYYDFEMKKQHGLVLSNILSKRFNESSKSAVR